MIRDTRKKTKPMAVAVVEQYKQARRELREGTLTTNQVAKKFGVTRQAVYKWVKAGLLEELDGPNEFGQLFDPVVVERFAPPPRGPKPNRT